jgi:SAM-dependent methyltransferase
LNGNQYNMSSYGDAWADIYDQYAVRGWPDPGGYVKFLAERADGGPAVELGIGTGRIALPLAAAGVPVIGIDASDKMLLRLREKATTESITLIKGDFSCLDLPSRYPLIYCVGQSFLQLCEFQVQQECLCSVARHLLPNGRFILECHTPDMRKFRRGQNMTVNTIFPDKLIFTASAHNRIRQQVSEATVIIGDGEVGVYPHFWRYCSLDELEHMADEAGMILTDVWGDPESGTPFSAKPGPWTAELTLKMARKETNES